MIELAKYSTLILDFDGVILNSNFQKEKNISKSLWKYRDYFLYDECLNYFNSNPGISRTLKLRKFIKDKKILKEVLNDYEKLNYKSLFHCELVPGIEEFLITNFGNYKLILLSGSNESELIDILEFKKIIQYFDFIGGASKSKIEHLFELNLKKKAIFFGDSKYDNKVADKFNLDFVFVKGYTKTKSEELEYNYKYEIENFQEI